MMESARATSEVGRILFFKSIYFIEKVYTFAKKYTSEIRQILDVILRKISTHWWNKADWSVVVPALLLIKEGCAVATPHRTGKKQRDAAQTSSVSGFVVLMSSAISIRSAELTTQSRAHSHPLDPAKLIATNLITNTELDIQLAIDEPGE
jgi:hypothetical protein